MYFKDDICANVYFYVVVATTWRHFVPAERVMKLLHNLHLLPLGSQSFVSNFANSSAIHFRIRTHFYTLAPVQSTRQALPSAPEPRSACISCSVCPVWMDGWMGEEEGWWW